MSQLAADARPEPAAERPPATDPTLVSNLLLPAFETGRLLNQLDWHLMQYVMLREKVDRERWEQILANLVERAIKLAPDPHAGRAAQASISETSEDWRAWFGGRYSPDSGEMHWLAWDSLQRSPADGSSIQELIERHFESIISDGTLKLLRIRREIEGNLKMLPERVRMAFLLGETLDQGLHPPGIQNYLIEELKPGPPPPDLTWGLPNQTQKCSSAPPKRFVGHARRPGDLLPPGCWANSMRARWTGLGIPSSLPDELVRQTHIAVTLLSGNRRLSGGGGLDTLRYAIDVFEFYIQWRLLIAIEVKGASMEFREPIVESSLSAFQRIYETAVAILVTSAKERSIDPEPIQLSAALCQRLFSQGIPPTLNKDNCSWPGCLARVAKNLTPQELDTIQLGKVRMRQLRSAFGLVSSSSKSLTARTFEETAEELGIDADNAGKANETANNVVRDANAVGTNKQTPADDAADHPNNDSVNEDAFAELLKFAENLKGIERRIVVLICMHHGACPLADLAIDEQIKWHMPCDDTFNSARTRINQKLKKIGWQVYRHDSEAKLKRLVRK